MEPKGVSSEAELYKQTLEPIPALDLDGLRSPQQFYDAIWSTLGDLTGWLDSLESSFQQVNL